VLPNRLIPRAKALPCTLVQKYHAFWTRANDNVWITCKWLNLLNYFALVGFAGAPLNRQTSAETQSAEERNPPRVAA
jgi:hypothetical protein